MSGIYESISIMIAANLVSNTLGRLPSDKNYGVNQIMTRPDILEAQPEEKKMEVYEASMRGSIGPSP